MSDKDYIYESPDGGKTIYRIKSGDYDNRELIKGGDLEVPEDYWCVSSVVDFEYVESNAVNTK